MVRKIWFSWVKPSTRAFFDEALKTANYSVFDWLHGYIYGRWVYFYIAVGTGEHPLNQTIGPIARRLITFFQGFGLPGQASQLDAHRLSTELVKATHRPSPA